MPSTLTRPVEPGVPVLGAVEGLESLVELLDGRMLGATVDEEGRLDTVEPDELQDATAAWLLGYVFCVRHWPF